MGPKARVKFMASCAEKISGECCKHESGRIHYQIGYIGLKCVKVAKCMDCEKLQYIGGTFGAMIFPLIVRFCKHARFEVVGTIFAIPRENLIPPAEKIFDMGGHSNATNNSNG